MSYTAPRWLRVLGYLWLASLAVFLLNPWTGPYDYLNGTLRVSQGDLLQFMFGMLIALVLFCVTRRKTAANVRDVR